MEQLSMGQQDALKGAILNHVKSYKEPTVRTHCIMSPTVTPFEHQDDSDKIGSGNTGAEVL